MVSSARGDTVICIRDSGVLVTDKEYEAWRAKQEEEGKHAKPVRDVASEVFGAPAGVEILASNEVGEDTDATDADPHPVEHDVKTPDAEAIATYEDAMAKRTDAVWYVVVGVVMLFLSSFHWGVGVGGMLMVLYGGFRYAQASNVARHAYDPWQDDDIDAWEKEEMEAEG